MNGMYVMIVGKSVYIVIRCFVFFMLMNIFGFLLRKFFLYKNFNMSVVLINLSVESICLCCVEILEFKIVIVMFVFFFVGNIL